jgi:hypothetical protein
VIEQEAGRVVDGEKGLPLSLQDYFIGKIGFY